MRKAKCSYCAAHGLSGNVSSCHTRCSSCGNQLSKEGNQLLGKPPCAPAAKSQSLFGRLVSFPDADPSQESDDIQNDSSNDQLQALRICRAQKQQVEEENSRLQAQVSNSEGLQRGLQHHIDELERVNLVLVQRLRLDINHPKSIQISTTELQTKKLLTTEDIKKLAADYKSKSNRDPVFSMDQVMHLLYVF